MGLFKREPIVNETSTLKNPSAWFLDFFGGRSSAGVRVSEKTAMSLSAYFCGCNMIAGTMAALPLNTYERTGPKSRQVSETHPVQRLLHDEPNPEMTAFNWRRTGLLHRIGRGNSYSEIVRDSRGMPAYLWPIIPLYVTPKRDSNGMLWYVIQIPGMERRYIPAPDMLHIQSISSDGIMGHGLIQAACDAIGLNAAQDIYASKYFENGGNIGATLETDEVLDDKSWDRLQKEIKEKFVGLTNAHRISLLEAGLKYKPLNPTNKETQLIEGRTFSVQEWARWLNMPPHKLKELTHATFSNITEQNIEWVVDTCTPWAVGEEQEYNRKLFRSKNKYYTKHVFEGLLRGDTKTRFEGYAIARNWGWMSANDILEKEDRNPLPGDIGDKYLIPSNMMLADQAIVGTNPATAKADQVVRAEEKHLRASSVEKAYTSEFIEWTAKVMSISVENALHYTKIAKQLTKIAMEREAEPEQVRSAKRSILVSMASGGAI